ncbi:hypothetical protein [Bdellovibrio svalbardensis]|uniref:Uncharacterized protein n=1 Tax=Bdellovibrio svalbardensis TaxID=2972972 RepID=A0ABT6DN09_9BACT|nr:hypothetical protein [Bdellovibrio svalbardensis]MDG0818262.1 hypothetical protein [Bdellovibrio svalbardensis]
MKLNKAIFLGAMTALLIGNVAQARTLLKPGLYEAGNYSVNVRTSKDQSIQSLEVVENGAYLATLEINDTTLLVGGYCNEDSGIASDVKSANGVTQARCLNEQGARVAVQIIDQHGDISEISFKAETKGLLMWKVRKQFSIKDLVYKGSPY